MDVDEREWVANRIKRRDEEPLDGMTELDRTISGNFSGKYLVIPPMTDAHNMKRIGSLLQGLGSDMVMLSNRHELSLRSKVLDLHDLINHANGRIREMTGKGKRKRPWERDR